MYSVRHGRLPGNAINIIGEFNPIAVGQLNKIISCDAQVLAIHYFTAMSQPSLIPVIAGSETPAFPSNILFFSSHSRFIWQSGPPSPMWVVTMSFPVDVKGAQVVL